MAALCCSICFNKHCDRQRQAANKRLTHSLTHLFTAGRLRPVDAAFIKLSWPKPKPKLKRCLICRQDKHSTARGPTSSAPYAFQDPLPPSCCHFSVITVQAAASEQSDNDLYSLKRFMAISSNIYSSMELLSALFQKKD